MLLAPNMQPMPEVDVIVFDVLGTLVDEPEGLRAAIREATSNADAGAIQILLEAWQHHILEQQSATAGGNRAFVDSEVLDAEAAEAVLRVAATHGIPTHRDALERLSTASRRLPPWSDSVTGLERITARLPVLALSNAAPTTLLHLAATTGLRWHHAVTAHSVREYKPAPALYQRAVQVADREPERILMVAAHAWDLRAAQAAGMRTCYVHRPVGDPPAPSEHFDMDVAGLDELVALLPSVSG